MVTNVTVLIFTNTYTLDRESFSDRSCQLKLAEEVFCDEQLLISGRKSRQRIYF